MTVTSREILRVTDMQKYFPVKSKGLGILPRTVAHVKAVDGISLNLNEGETLGLLASIPRRDRRTDRLDPIKGNPPSPLRHPSGCVFHPRCKYTDRVPANACFEVRPELLPSEPGHLVRCHIPADERRAISAEVLAGLTAQSAAVAGATE